MAQAVSSPQPTQEVLQDLKKSSLRYVNDKMPGITRVKKGKEFGYINEDGALVKDKTILKRIEDLVIPPAWEKVWICKLSNGHIQATGIDEKGRKQYLYHEDWNKIMQQNKFNKVIFFGEVLPTLRTEIQAGMAERGLTKRRILATIIWLLEHTYIRIGNEEYAKENKSYGLTTLHPKHVDVVGDTVKFEFKGKSGKFHSIEVDHPRVAKTIRKLEELPGYILFQYVDSEGERHSVDSEEVNDYLKQITGEDISAKDFRTWGGTTFAAETLYKLGTFENKTQANKNISETVKAVSKNLGNTTTVCRTYYIHPTVINTYQKKILIPHFDEVKEKIDKKPQRLHVDEYAVISLLKEYPAQLTS